MDQLQKTAPELISLSAKNDRPYSWYRAGDLDGRIPLADALGRGPSDRWRQLVVHSVPQLHYAIDISGL